jgi:hypothetical protein
MKDKMLDKYHQWNPCIFLIARDEKTESSSTTSIEPYQIGELCGMMKDMKQKVAGTAHCHLIMHQYCNMRKKT